MTSQPDKPSRPPPKGAIRLGDTRWRLRDDVVQLVMDPRGDRLLACDDHSVYALDAVNGRVLAESNYPADHLSLAHGALLATSYSVKIFDSTDFVSHKQLFLDEDYPNQSHLVDGGRRVLVSTGEGKLVLFDRESGEQVQRRDITDRRIAEMLVGGDTVYVLSDERVRLVSLDNLKEFTHWAHSSDEPLALALAPGGGHLAVGLESGKVVLLDPHDVRVVATLDIEGYGPVCSLAHSSDGDLVAAGDAGGAVRVWQTSSRTCTLLSASNLPVRALAFSLDGTRLAVGTGGCIQWWDIEQRSLLNPTTGHIGAVQVVAFGDDGTMATMSRDSVRVWDVGSWRIRDTRKASRGYGESFTGLAWAGDHYRVALSVGSRLKVQDLAHGRELLDVEQEQDRGDWVALAPDGRTLAWADYFNARLWSLSETGEEQRVEVDLDYTVARAWQPARGALVVGNDRGHLTFCSPVGSKARVRYRRGRVSAIAVSANGRRVAIAAPSYARHSCVGIWERATEHQMASAPLTAHLLSFSGDGLALAAANAQIISLVDAWQGTEFARWESKDRWIHAVAFSPGERHLVAGLSGGTVLVWDLDSVGGPWSVSRWCHGLADYLRGRGDRDRASPYRSAPVARSEKSEVHLLGPDPRVVLGSGERALCLEVWPDWEGFGLRLTEGVDPPSRAKPSYWRRLAQLLTPRPGEPTDPALVRGDLEEAGLKARHIETDLVDGKRVVTLDLEALPPVEPVARLMEVLLQR